ncbi:MAG: hypothetical protein AABX38_01435 [Candidatus Micrarchaeota archaeon]
MKRRQLHSPVLVIDPKSAEGRVIANATTKPSIYGKRAKPLISKYPKAYRVESKYFETFFRGVVEEVKQPLDPKELRRLLAMATFSSPMEMKIESKDIFVTDLINGFHVYLAGCLFLRSLYIHFTDDKERGTEFALNAIKELEAWKYWPFYLDITENRRVMDTLYWLKRRIPNSSKEKIREMLDEFYFYSLKTQERIESDVEINHTILEEFAKHIRRIIRHKPLWAIFQNDYSNLLAIFGSTLQSSDIPMSRIDNKTSDHIAVLLQHPCEADQLEKAKVMLERGVQVERPLGKLFVNDQEFSLFRWVEGTRLDKINEVTIWEAYGRFIRFAHKNGIAINDAAGRNAIWNGKEVIGIDFEHTWISKEAVPLEWADRRPAIQRIKNELSNETHLYRAFRKGYDSY